MENTVIFCKSYRKDIYRVKRLAESIDRFNIDSIPFFMSAPQSDLNEFKGKFNSIPCNFITDEDILKKTSQDFGDVPSSFPKHLLQQLVNLEFWRMDLCENYVWADSDSYFIRSFSRSDFLHNESYPYTVQHDLKDLRDFALRWNRTKIIRDFEERAKTFQNISNRSGFFSILVHLLQYGQLRS